MDKQTSIIYIAVDIVIFCTLISFIVMLCHQQMVASDEVRESSDMNTTVTSNLTITDYEGFTDTSMLGGEIKYNGVFTKAEVYGAIMSMDAYDYKVYTVDEHNSKSIIDIRLIENAQTGDDTTLKSRLVADKYSVYNAISTDGKIVAIYYKVL